MENDSEYIYNDICKQINCKSIKKVPFDLIELSHDIFLNYKENDKDYLHLHDEKLNALQGKSIVSCFLAQTQDVNETSILLSKYINMEKKFKDTILKEDCFVFRGLKLNDLSLINNDSDTITFVTNNLEKALRFFSTPWVDSTNKDSKSVLLVIKLKKGTPIITTSIQDELILPYSSVYTVENIIKYKSKLDSVKNFIKFKKLPHFVQFDEENINIKPNDRYIVYMDRHDKIQKRVSQYDEVKLFKRNLCT